MRKRADLVFLLPNPVVVGTSPEMQGPLTDRRTVPTIPRGPLATSTGTTEHSA